MAAAGNADATSVDVAALSDFFVPAATIFPCLCSSSRRKLSKVCPQLSSLELLFCERRQVPIRTPHTSHPASTISTITEIIAILAAAIFLPSASITLARPQVAVTLTYHSNSLACLSASSQSPPSLSTSSKAYPLPPSPFFQNFPPRCRVIIRVVVF